jgi:hypothetical protein
MGSMLARPPEARASAPSRATARIATAVTVLTWVAVALLSSRTRSPLTPPLPPGAEAPWFLSRTAMALGLDRLPKEVAGLLSGVLLLSAGLAFLYSARAAWRGNLTVRRVLVVGIALHALALAMPLFLSRDVYSYTIYGRMLSAHGGNPYVSVPAAFPDDPVSPYVSPDWSLTPSLYGPAFVVLAAGLTRVAQSPAAAIVGFKLLAVLASTGTMLLVAAAVRRARPERAAFAAAMIGWNPVVVLHGAAGGHSDALVALGVATAVLLILRRRDLLGTGVLALGTLVKVSGGVPLLLAVIGAVARRPRGERLRAAAAHVGIAAAVAAPFVVPFLQTRNPTLGFFTLTKLQAWWAPSRLLGVTLRELGRVLGSPAAGEVLAILVRLAFPAAFLAALVGMCRHLGRQPHRIDPVLVVGAMAWMSILGLMSSPLLLPWYVVWFLPLAWVLPRTPRIAAVVMSAALAITELIAEPSRAPLAWEVMGFGIQYVVTPLILVLLVWLLRDLRARLRLAPAEGFLDPVLLDSASAEGLGRSGSSAEGRRGVSQGAKDDRRPRAPRPARGRRQPVRRVGREHGDGQPR